MRKLQAVRTRYNNNFTMHGLEHIINGTWVEKIFWTLKLIVAVSIAGWLSKELFQSYLDHDTTTVIEVNTVRQIQVHTL